MTISEAQDLLRFCLGHGGKVIPTRHFRDELAKEDLTIPAAWHVLKKGTIYKPPELHPKTMEWTYHVEGQEPDGKWLEIVFCFQTIETAKLITVFSVGARKRS
jgi:hypothetical protein